MLGLRGKVGIFFVLSVAQLGLLVLTALMNAVASFGDGNALTAFDFVIAFVWLPSLWAGFAITATIVWVMSAMRNLRTNRKP